MTLAFSVGLGSLIGLIQYKALIAGSNIIGIVAHEGTEQIARIAGLTHNPNAYSIILMSGIPLLLFLTTNASSFLCRKVSVFFFFTSVISLFITISRTSIVGFLLFMFIYISLNFKHKNISKKQLVSVVIIILFLLLLFYVFLFDIVKQRSFSFEHIRDEARYYILLKGIKVFIEHPLFGIGFGNFALLDRFDNKYGFIYGRGGHDIISDFFASVGLVGTLLFIILCFKTLRYYNLSIKLFINNNSNKYLLNLAITLKSAFIALLFTCFGDSLIFQRIFWIYIALGVIMYSWGKHQFRINEKYLQIFKPLYLHNS
jgi:O-antigen ligase